MSLVSPSMLGEWSLDTDAATGISLGLLFRRLRQMMNAIMAARTTAPADETPTTRDTRLYGWKSWIVMVCSSMPSADGPCIANIQYYFGMSFLQIENMSTVMGFSR